MTTLIHANPMYIGAAEHAERLAEIYGSAGEALWVLIGDDWEKRGPKVQQRWRSRVIEELSRRQGYENPRLVL